MDTSGSLNTPGGFAQTPGNVGGIDLGSGGQAHGSSDSNELSVHDPARRTERYDTPPYFQTVSSLILELLAADIGIVLALWRQ